MSAAEFTAIRLTAELAALSTVLLLIIGTPVAWWLSRTRSRLKPLWSAVVAMPIVLPPSVLGFYLLLLMGPFGPVGRFTESVGLGRLPFTFGGLVVASVLYTMPFVIQPLQQAFDALGDGLEGLLERLDHERHRVEHRGHDQTAEGEGQSPEPH